MHRWTPVLLVLVLSVLPSNAMDGSGDDSIMVISVSPTTSVTTYGDSTTLTCDVTSPSPVSISWTTTADIELPSVSVTVVNETQYSGSITLANVTSSYAGNYTCTAINEYDRENSTTTLSVYVPPPNVTVTPLSTTVNYSDTVTLVCQVSSLPEVNIVWTTTADNISLTQPEVVSVTEGSSTSTLVLTKVTLDHVGNYTCTATNSEEGAMDSATSSVNVLVQPPSGIIIDTLQYIDYNQTFTASCVVQSFVDVTFQWSIADNQPLDPATTFNSTTYQYTSTVTVNQATLETTSVTCTASNSAGSNSLTQEFHINVDPPVVSVSPSFSRVPSNSSITLTCSVVSFTNAVISWSSTSNSFSLPNPTTNPEEELFVSDFSFSQLTANNSGNYTCTARNMAGITPSLSITSRSDTAVLEVFIPTPEVTVTPDPITQLANTSVSFTCSIISFSEPNVIWTTTASDKNITQPEVLDDSKVGVYTSVLTLRGILPANEGSYTCTVTNENGTASDAGSLSVTVPGPEVSVTPDAVSELPLTSGISFTCTVVSFSEPNITWTTTSFFNFFIPPLVTESEEGVYTSTLSFSNLLPAFNGSYTCTAVNENGIASDTSILNVIIVQPEPTITGDSDINFGDQLLLRCSVRSFVSFSFTWTGPDNQPLNPVESTLGLFDYASTVTVNSSTLDTRGTYVCTVNNTGGTGSDSVNVTVFVPPPVVEAIPDQAVAVADNVTFICEATGIELSYQWTFDPKIFNCLTHVFEDCIQGESEQVLRLFFVPTHFTTTVTCTVTDIDNQAVNQSASLTVNGLELLEQTMAPSSNPLTRVENDTFTFYCVFSFPREIRDLVSVRWLEGGVEINISSTLLVTTKHDQTTLNSTLTFNPLDRFYMKDVPFGPFTRVYSCEGVVGDRYQVERGVGIHLIVEFAPFFMFDFEEQPLNPTRINVTETEMIGCFAVGNPTSMNHLEAALNDSVFEMVSTITTDNGIVTYNLMSDEPANVTYRCVAQNKHGLQFHEFIVLFQDRPEKINSRTIKTTLVSLFSVRVEWEAPFDNYNSILTYHVSYIEDLQGARRTRFAVPSGTSTLLENPGINRNYTLSVSAENEVGVSDESTAILFSSVTSSDASLTDVRVPRVLITSSSFYVQWSYPQLLTDPLYVSNEPETTATVKHVLISWESNKESETEPQEVFYPNTFINITNSDGIMPDTLYTVSVNIIYNNPANLQGIARRFERQTLSTGNTPEVVPMVDEDALQGENPSLDLSWDPLGPEDGAEFLSQYIVRITITRLPQTFRSKRQQPDSQTMDITVDKSQTSYQFDAEPFTQYTTQVLAELNVNGDIMTRPITAPSTVESEESVPTAPRNLQVEGRVDYTSVSLSWSIPDPPNGFITQYTVYQEDSGGNTMRTVVSDGTSHTSNSVTGGMMYTYTVTANTSAGEGPPSNSTTVVTPAGVYPFNAPSIAKGTGRLITVILPTLSTSHGPLSHYIIVVVTGSAVVRDTSIIYPYRDDRWRDLGYYGTAVVSSVTANAVNNTFTIGSGTFSARSAVEYYNAPLDQDVAYSVLIRVFSGADDPVVVSRDSATSNSLEFPSSAFPITAVVIPIVIILLVLIIVIVIVVVITILIRRTPKHTESFYLDEIKTSVIKPLTPEHATPPRNGSASRTTSGVKVQTPTVSVQTSEVFTSIGQPTILLAEVNGTPEPEVLWSKDGRTLQSPEYKILADGSLYIVNTELKDDGNYIVSAYNDGGTVEEAVRVVVIAPLPPEPDINHPPQTVSEFIERMALLHSTMDEQLEDEYHDIELDWNITVYNAKLPVNHNKNRYVNIIPYDHSRVVLNIQDNASGTDYINGSFIDGYNEQNSYIATQGPIPSTFPDFWRMLWEYNIPTIVMVTNLKEDEKIKCHQYWPSYGATNYGDIQVTLKEVENIVDYSIRTFQLQPIHGGPMKEIRQFHFQVWPDHGVPQYATALLGFRKRIKKYHSTQKGPMAVHCSAGVGRTGTFICIDVMMKMIEAEGKIDIFNFVRHMRFRRNYMVQTSTQYEFIHEALLETIMCGDTSLPVKSLNQRVLELDKIDPVSGKSGFLTQFQTLDSSSPNDEEFDCSVAQLPDNLAKTRSSKHLPPNENRVVLSTKKYDSDYICASFIDGYRQRQCFITTQGPMKNTAGDFWRMVWEYNTSAIVMLTQLEENGVEQCVQYWPSNEQEIWGSFAVDRCQEDRVLPDYTVRKFNIHHIENPDDKKTITQFHYTGWSSDACPTNGASLNDMIGEVLRVQRKSGNNHIVVHCSDGLGRTGTFCATFTILERVKAEQVVDVFSTVKSLRIQRPGLLETLDQYEFIHKVVVEFLTTFDNYDNFK